MDDLLARVAAEYAPWGLPAWPDPHPDGRQPLEVEYSRITDPQRWAVVHARARAWTTVLERVLGARAERWTATPGHSADGGFSRGVGLTSPRPETVPLLLLERDHPLPTLRVCADDTSWVLLDEPYCGCDACDDGSQAAFSHRRTGNPRRSWR